MTAEGPDPKSYIWVTLPPNVTDPEKIAQFWLVQAKLRFAEARLTHKLVTPTRDIHGNMYVASAVLRTGPRIIVLRFGDNSDPAPVDTRVGETTKIIDTTGVSKPRSTVADLPTRELKARRPPVVFDRDPLSGEDEEGLARIFTPIIPS